MKRSRSLKGSPLKRYLRDCTQRQLAASYRSKLPESSLRTFAQSRKTLTGRYGESLTTFLLQKWTSRYRLHQKQSRLLAAWKRQTDYSKFWRAWAINHRKKRHNHERQNPPDSSAPL